MSRKLLQKQQIEMYKMVLEITRQLMIPLGLILLAAVLFYYDETLVRYFQSKQIIISIFPRHIRLVIKSKNVLLMN